MATAPRKKPSKVKTSAYDVAEHLRTPEEMAAYLDAWLEEAPDDISGIARALGDIARAKGMSLVAKEAGLSRESLYRALNGLGSLDVGGYVVTFGPASRHGNRYVELAVIGRNGQFRF